MRKAFLCVSLFFLIISPTWAFEWRERTAYIVETDSYRNWEFVWFEPDEFPLSICIEKGHFSKREIELITAAVRIWNEEFTKFVKNGWPGRIVYGLPGSNFMMQRTLLTISCREEGDGYRKGFVIHFLKKSWKTEETLGFLRREWVWFVGTSMEIAMPVKSTLDINEKTPYRPHFIDVVLHEIGHALGIPHLKDDYLMHPWIRGCQKKAPDICKPGFNTFLSFIETYYVNVLSEQDSKEVFEEHRRHQEYLMRNPPRGPNGILL